MAISRVISRAAVVASSVGLVTAPAAALAAEPAAAAAVQYVALGDSYSSGLAAGDYTATGGSCAG